MQPDTATETWAPAASVVSYSSKVKRQMGILEVFRVAASFLYLRAVFRWPQFFWLPCFTITSRSQLRLPRSGTRRQATISLSKCSPNLDHGSRALALRAGAGPVR